MATQVQTTRVVDTVKTSAVKSADELSKKYLGGRALGSPINGREIGDKFDVTMSGNIEISDTPQGKKAHFTTKEGYRIAVHAGFDPAIFKEGTKHNAVCKEWNIDGRTGKYTAFVL